ncbi:MAG: hypothetical protein J1E82_04425 [Muribaculaceae bacterium]|nr:hypothetical protein [Muribaculaceae bacterium]
MKKLIFLTIAAVITMTGFTSCELEPDEVIENVVFDDMIYTVYTKDKTATLTGYRIVSTDITIPATITYKEKVYSVTAIEDKAFHAAKRTDTLVIGSNIQSIGYEAFYSLIKVDTEIYCYPVTPPNCRGGNFTYGYGILHVPAGSVNAYRNAKNFAYREIIGDL